MDPSNILKIIATIITAVIALIIGLRVLSLNKSDLLNRWFAIYFISSSLGFIIYAIYHLILNNTEVIIPLMITAQIFFNFNSISLIMTLFVLEKYTKIAMSMRYLGSMLVVFFVMSIGYFIFTPSLNMEAYAAGIVDTNTPHDLFIFVNTIRLILATFAAYKYIIITRKIEGENKNRIKWFSSGVIIFILGLVINLTGGLLSIIVIEILALIIFDIGALLVLKG
ncbi:MAG: hypothetical protein KAW66_02760, partial [Candidatus Lokiarchaeota archaeon]|nr:hypothetical protein [Candidatus Lokiarchaeota archaeon]